MWTRDEFLNRVQPLLDWIRSQGKKNWWIACISKQCKKDFLNYASSKRYAALPSSWPQKTTRSKSGGYHLYDSGLRKERRMRCVHKEGVQKRWMQPQAKGAGNHLYANCCTTVSFSDFFDSCYYFVHSTPLSPALPLLCSLLLGDLHATRRHGSRKWWKGVPTRFHFSRKQVFK